MSQTVAIWKRFRHWPRVGGSDKPDLPAEFSKIPQCGSIARPVPPLTKLGQQPVFANFSDNDFLNVHRLRFGHPGMDHVDVLTRGEPPVDPDRMISMKVAADA
jgi:peptidylprolyl isomerase